MKITIVGGGTAGWLTALFLIKYNKLNPQNPLKINLIESPKIPIIGAGEGSTGLLKETLGLLSKDIPELNEIDFLHESNATIKLGIEFTDWNYPFHNFYSPLSSTTNYNYPFDIVHFIFSKYGLPLESTRNEILWKNLLSPISNNQQNESFYAYHFDAHKVGEYFKKISLQNGVNYISDEVVNLKFNQNNILDKVYLNNQQIEYTSDFWIDCSGFSKVLINPNKDNWMSYSKYLPTNNALAYTYNYQENENIKPSTLAKAMPHGWMWQIPTTERYGCGYVYCDDFINQEKAHKEVETITQRKIENFRSIKFEAGRVKKVWKGNVLAIGLSSSFLEPLEATSIHTTLSQLLYFIEKNLTTNKSHLLNPLNIESYNNYFSLLVDEFKDLVQMHYMVTREDTNFWKSIKYDLKVSDYVKEIISICNSRIPKYKDFKNHFGAANWAVWKPTLEGLGYIKPLHVNNILNSLNQKEIKEIYEKEKLNNYSNINNFEKNKDFINFIKNYNV